MNWFATFDEKHPTLSGVLVTVVLLLALGLAGIGDEPFLFQR